MMDSDARVVALSLHHPHPPPLLSRCTIGFLSTKRSVCDSKPQQCSSQHTFSSKKKYSHNENINSFNPERGYSQPKIGMAVSDKRIAKLVANKSVRVPLPTFVEAHGKSQPLSKFLQQRAGMECMLNTKALQQYEQIGANVFRCFLPKVEILNFEVAPIVDLRVLANNDECIVEMLSCKFEGSEVVESQNERFSASMRNHLTWNGNSKEQALDVKVELKLFLEIYTLPFTLLPISAVEMPGNVIMQALVDRLVPLFLEQLFDDYKRWTLSCASDSEVLGLTSFNMEE